jgi:hypothetical protein
MSSYHGIIKKEYKPKVQSLRDDLRARRDPTFFWPTGTQVYVGQQGSGKTISAVKHLIDLKKRYPLAIVVSNLTLNNMVGRQFRNQLDLDVIFGHDFDPVHDYIKFKTMDELAVALTKVNNGFHGVIYIVDEIHTYFNALDSKNIPMYVFTEISQQRKQRKLIIGTSQLFLRMAKPFREQCDNLIICKTRFGFITFQKAYDGMSLTQDYDGTLSGELKKSGWFYHTKAIRNAFDTYQKVVSGAEQYENIQPNLVIQEPKKKMFGK